MYHLTSITSQGPSLNIWEILYKNNKKTLIFLKHPIQKEKQHSGMSKSSPITQTFMPN